MLKDYGFDRIRQTIDLGASMLGIMISRSSCQYSFYFSGGCKITFFSLLPLFQPHLNTSLFKFLPAFQPRSTLNPRIHYLPIPHVMMFIISDCPPPLLHPH